MNERLPASLVVGRSVVLKGDTLAKRWEVSQGSGNFWGRGDLGGRGSYRATVGGQFYVWSYRAGELWGVWAGRLRMFHGWTKTKGSPEKTASYSLTNPADP